MSGQHTQGRLKCDGQCHLDDGCLLVEDCAEIHCVASADHPDDARRLAACWNACEDIPTADLEAGATLAEICAKSNGYQIKLAAARALLAGILAEAEGWHDDCRGTPLDSGIADEVRAFLKGGA